MKKVCDPATVELTEYLTVERYSHVMHLVSTIAGTQRAGMSAYDVLKATFPAGTLSGAPKPEIFKISDELEPQRRGIYGGTVGYFDFAGNMDMEIAIRTGVIREGVAHIQAGAGLVKIGRASCRERGTVAGVARGVKEEGRGRGEEEKDI